MLDLSFSKGVVHGHHNNVFLRLELVLSQVKQSKTVIASKLIVCPL